MRTLVFCCISDRGELQQLLDFSTTQSPCEERDADAYETACSQCGKLVEIIDARVQRIVVASLIFVKRKGGFRGRALERDVPELSLLRGDRLAPNHFLRDVGRFEELVPPFHALFWRHSNKTFCNQRNPLFSPSTNINVTTLALDVLHCLHLGVYKAYCTAVLWAVIMADV